MEERWKNKKILIVEDNTSNYRLLEAILKSKKIEFDWVTDGLQAIQAIQNNKYDLIIMDIQLPELDGFEVTQKVREFDKDVPIIAITAFAMFTSKSKCMEYGCNDFIIKPFRSSALLPLLNKYL